MGIGNSSPRRNRDEFPLELYSRSQNPVGSGGFGIVHRYTLNKPARNANLPEIIAVKFKSVEKEKEDVDDKLEADIQTLKSLRHRNIVQFHGRNVTQQTNGIMVDVNLVMEHCDGALDDLLRARVRLTPNEAAIVIKQVLRGLQYLHSKKIIHRDIKPGNVLLVTDLPDPNWRDINVEDLLIKLGDFGLSKLCDTSKKLSKSLSLTPCGTEAYMAPELRKAYDDEQSMVRSHATMDSYSMGVIAHKVVTGGVPTIGKEDEELPLVQDLYSDTVIDRLDKSVALVSFLHATLGKDYKSRLSVEKLVNHSFVKEAPVAATPSQRRKANEDLFTACEEGQVGDIEACLEEGADLEHKSGDYIQSPLNIASERGHASVVRLLLEVGAKVDSTDKWDRTPLYYSAWKGHDEVVKLLLEHNANQEMPNRDGVTPLMAAAMAGQINTVLILLGSAANFKKRDNEGKRALDWAKIKSKERVVAILLDHERLHDHAEANA